jgi:glucose-6-phosphate-specific signal transduction histidine kinase
LPEARGGAVAPEGHRIAGMRERAALYGGNLVAAPCSRWRVRVSATLPRHPDLAA